MRIRLKRVAGGKWRVFSGLWQVAGGKCSPLFLCLLLVTLGAGCRLVQTAVEVPGETVRAVTPGKKDKTAVDPVEVQQQLMRFADEFSTRLIVSVEQLRLGTNALDPAEALQWKIALGTETCSIASGPNAIADLLDMTVFVTVTRMALEENWMPKAFGESARPMLEGCRNAETNIWQFAGQVLKPAQQAELRAAIKTWRRQNPMPESVLSVRAVGFASQVAQANQTDTAKPGSVFNLLDLDPLSGLDPATREIAQTRLFAERALYVTQKLPTLLRWQAELLSINAVDLPAVRQLVTNSTQIAASVDRFASVAGQLPGQVSAEREEILKALQSQETQLTPLVNEMRETLTAGTAMSTSLNTTLTTFTTLMQRFGVGDTNNASPPDTNSTPFRIQDYTQIRRPTGGDGAAVDRDDPHARPDARFDQSRETFGATRSGGSAGANRRQGNRGLRLLERRLPGGRRAGRARGNQRRLELLCNGISAAHLYLC